MTSSVGNAAIQDDGPAFRKPRVMIAGEFSAGKSTLVNALIGKEILPSNVTSTSLPPIWLTAGSGDPFIVMTDGSVTDFSIEDIDVYSTAYCVLPVEADLLNYVDIIDTPGNSDPNIPSECWERMVRYADGLIWCTSAMQAWKQSEKATCGALPKELLENAMVMITQADRMPDDRSAERVMRRVARGASDLISSVMMGSSLSAEDVGRLRDHVASLPDLLPLRGGAEPLVDAVVRNQAVTDVKDEAGQDETDAVVTQVDFGPAHTEGESVATILGVSLVVDEQTEQDSNEDISMGLSQDEPADGLEAHLAEPGVEDQQSAIDTAGEVSPFDAPHQDEVAPAESEPALHGRTTEETPESVSPKSVTPEDELGSLAALDASMRNAEAEVSAEAPEQNQTEDGAAGLTVEDATATDAQKAEGPNPTSDEVLDSELLLNVKTATKLDPSAAEHKPEPTDEVVALDLHYDDDLEEDLTPRTQADTRARIAEIISKRVSASRNVTMGVPVDGSSWETPTENEPKSLGLPDGTVARLWERHTLDANLSDNEKFLICVSSMLSEVQTILKSEAASAPDVGSK